MLAVLPSAEDGIRAWRGHGRAGDRESVPIGLGRHEHDMAVAHAALGDHTVGERLHLGARPL